MTKSISFRRSEKKMYDFLLQQGDYSYYLKELIRKDENYLQFMKLEESPERDMSIKSQIKSKKKSRKIVNFVTQ